MTARTLFAVGLALACTVSDPAAQSLGKVAEQEAARRQRVAGGKQYTNDDLKPELRPAGAPVPAPAAAPPEAPAEAAKPAPAAPASSATAEQSDKPIAKEHRDEAYWRGRVRELRSHMTRLQGEIKAMETRMEELGGQPGGAGELTVTQSALTRLRSNLRSFSEEFDAFQARGRRANVPAEWLQ